MLYGHYGQYSAFEFESILISLIAQRAKQLISFLVQIFLLLSLNAPCSSFRVR